MLNAFIATFIVLAILAFGYGFMESWAGSMSDAPGEGMYSAKVGGWTMGISWVAIWGLISIACAINGHAYAAVIVAASSALFTLAVAAFLWFSAYQLSHH